MNSDQRPPAESPTPDPTTIQARAVRLATIAFGPFFKLDRNVGLFLVAGGPVAFVAGLLSGDRLVAIASGLAALTVGFTWAWLPLRSRSFRAARELLSDHNCHEAAEWKRDTGTNMPRGLKAVERWLDEHPTSRGRASLLLPVGRIAEADRAIEAIVPKTPEEAFSVDILRQTRTLLLGGAPDLEPLNARWRDLPNPRERRHRRECLAVLEAQVAVANGADPVAVMARARGEIDDVYWRYRTAWTVGGIFFLAAGLVLFFGLLAVSLVE